MDRFTSHTGIAAPLLRNNVDTDAIIPSREMKTVSKRGLSDGLFAQWRYIDEKARTPNPDFVLNKLAYQRASVLLSGNNFGCGSSREHAVWALKEYGIRCIIAQSYGAIFFRNCIANGILAICLEQNLILELASMSTKELTVDLHEQTIRCDRNCHPFDITENDKHSLLHGIDPIAATLSYQPFIDQFTQQDKKRRPWLY